MKAFEGDRPIRQGVGLKKKRVFQPCDHAECCVISSLAKLRGSIHKVFEYLKFAFYNLYHNTRALNYFIICTVTLNIRKYSVFAV